MSSDHSPVLSLDEHMPHWATGIATELAVGAQLCTRDGRKVGNAVIAGTQQERHGHLLWPVLTDAGTVLHLSTAEVEELFYQPQWLMDPATAPGAQVDDVLDALDLTREQFRSEGGAINRAKLRAAIKHPADYLPPEHWLRAAGVPGEPTDEDLRRIARNVWFARLTPDDAPLLQYAREVLARYGGAAVPAPEITVASLSEASGTKALLLMGAFGAVGSVPTLNQPLPLDVIADTLTGLDAKWRLAAAVPAQVVEPFDERREIKAWSDWAWNKAGEPVGCQSGQAASREAWLARAALTAQPAAAPESAQAVAWQSRTFLGGQWTKWQDCEAPEDPTEREVMLNGRVAYQLRPLYTEQHPAPARVAVALTERDLLNCVQRPTVGDTLRLTRDTGPYEVTVLTFDAQRLFRAIERASWAANGLSAPVQESGAQKDMSTEGRT